jgi:hypothetical protein
MEINPNPAQQITAETTETFQDFANRVFKASKRSIRHGNGLPVEIEPGGIYSTLLIKVKKLLTAEKFFEVQEYIERGIIQAVMDGVVEPDWFQGITTPFDLHPPEVPEHYKDDDHEIKAYLVGETGFVFTQTPIPEVIAEEDATHN